MFIRCLLYSNRCAYQVNELFILVEPLEDSTNNLARGKRAEQSSTYRTYGATRAVDGNKATALNQHSCTKTAVVAGYAWWVVYLDSVCEIVEVVITDRGSHSSKSKYSNS